MFDRDPDRILAQPNNKRTALCYIAPYICSPEIYSDLEYALGVNIGLPEYFGSECEFRYLLI